MTINEKKKWAIITSLFPFIGLGTAIKANKTSVYTIVFALFFFFIGTQIIVTAGNDFGRYMTKFFTLSMQSTIPFERYFTSLDESNQIDYFEPFLVWFVSRFTSNTQIYGGILSMLFGICFSLNFKYIAKYCDSLTKLLVILLFLLFFIPNPSFYTHRWWLAMQVFLLGALPYILEGKYKCLLFSIASILIHFSFLYPLVILLVYKFLPQRSLLPYVILFLATNTINTIDIGSIATIYEQYLPDSFNSRNEMYINAEFQDHNWFSQSAQTAWKLTNIGLTLFIFTRLKSYLENRHEYKSMFVCALLFGTFSAITNMTEWGWRYLDVTNFFFCSLFILILSDTKNRDRQFNNAIRLASPFFIYIILFQIRGVLAIIGLNALFMGNLFTTWFIEDPVSVLSFIKN